MYSKKDQICYVFIGVDSIVKAIRNEIGEKCPVCGRSWCYHYAKVFDDMPTHRLFVWCNHRDEVKLETELNDASFENVLRILAVEHENRRSL